MFDQLLVVFVIHVLGLISPGPDLAVVMSTVAKSGTKAGVRTALGIASGIVLHVTYSLVGVAALIKSRPVIFDAIRVAGAMYIFYMAYKLITSSIRSTNTTFKENNSVDVRKKAHFISGFVTNITNPKATLFFLAVFSQVVRPNTSTSAKLVYGIMMVLTTFCWFALVSAFVGNKYVRKAYREKVWVINLVFGLILAILGSVVIIEVLK
jgi:RhtB (resistance to homoserine/threonine) family protein